MLSDPENSGGGGYATSGWYVTISCLIQGRRSIVQSVKSVVIILWR